MIKRFVMIIATTFAIMSHGALNYSGSYANGGWTFTFQTDGTFEYYTEDGVGKYRFVKNPTCAYLYSFYWNGEGQRPDNIALPAMVDLSNSLKAYGLPVVDIRGSSLFTSFISVSIPEGITAITYPAFQGSSLLESLVVPDSVKVIATSMCYNCSSLRSVRLPNSLTTIPTSAFGSCSSLTMIYIPESVSSIEACVFNGCTALSSVSLPIGLESIGGWAFANCSSLSSIELPGKVKSIEEFTFANCSSLQTVIIPNAVCSISASAFEGCEKITTVTIPARFRASEVFPNSYRIMKSVTIPDGATAICPFAFHECRMLDSVVIPEGVTEIGESAFENCRHLETVIIPKSVRYIGDSAFYGCLSLKEVKYLGEKPEIGNAAFAGTALATGQTVELMINSANVHYVLNSIKPEFAVPLSEDTGFRNIITEIKGGAVSIPSTWASNYANFEKKFGTDFTKALMKTTGKFGGDGKELMVWQDYIAGTDPTDEKDVFTASVTVVDGKVTVSYSPELDDGRKAVRKYTTWGKQQLQDAEWTEVPPGQEGNYNFFKVSVEMK